MRSAKRNYHHGDLRQALVDEGLKLLERGSVEELSLREVARNAGVSATAVYRHFPSKDTLMKALADHGLKMLAEQQQAAAVKARGAAGFAETGRAYVRFALANPNLFRLVFTHRGMSMHPGIESPKGSAAWLLRSAVARALGPRASAEKRFAAALRAWSLVHGLSMLILDKQVDPTVGEALIDQIISGDGRKLD